MSSGTLLLVLCAGLVLSACQAEEEPEVLEEPTVETPMETTPDISDLEGDPLQYVGQTVTVEGDVSEVYGPNAFTVTGGLFTGDLPVIVPPNQAMTPVAEGDDVQITGEVRAYVLTEIETEYGFDLTPEIEAELEENEPVLVAQTITPIMESEGLGTEGLGTEGAGTEGTGEEL